MELTSQKMRRLAPELDPLRLGTGWKPEDLAKPQIIVESTFGDSHPGSGHLDKLVAAACRGIADAGGHGARYFCTDICDWNEELILQLYATLHITGDADDINSWVLD